MKNKIVIAIDGPAGSGKSTIAKAIAQNLNFIYLDTGAMYRAITYLALKENLKDNFSKIIERAKESEVNLNFNDGKTIVHLNDLDITEEIRSPQVNAYVSEIARIPEIRNLLVKMQKEIGMNHSIVAEGRDTTTVVFPDADIKIFLTAKLETRAERRYKEYQDNGQEVDFTEVKENLQKRDHIDSSREVSPLRKANDAYELDNSGMTIEEEIKIIMELINKLLDEGNFNNN